MLLHVSENVWLIVYGNLSMWLMKVSVKHSVIREGLGTVIYQSKLHSNGIVSSILDANVEFFKSAGTSLYRHFKNVKM